jgi:manganese transport protein
VCFAIEMILSHPDLRAAMAGLIPREASGRISLFGRGPGGATVLGLTGESLYIAMGILGATVMPHNLYLHSALVQSRAVERSVKAKREACQMNLVDSVVALNCAFFVNAAILILAAAAFHASGHQDVARLEDAHSLLAPLLGTSLASVCFAVALLSAGQSSTITGTLAGQIVMEGFLRIRIRPWLRRLISRGLAIIPAVAFIALRGANRVDELLVLSQVVLSLQLSFAVIPLITFTSDREKMGEFANKAWVVALAVTAAAVILGLNITLVAQQLGGWLGSGSVSPWLRIVVSLAVGLVGALLLYVTLSPLIKRFVPALARRAASAPVAPHAAEAATVPAGAAHLRPAEADEPARTLAVALELGAADADVLEHVGAESLDRETREDQVALEAIADQFRALGVQVSVVLGYGDAAPELARIVNTIKADLLITGSHGHRALQDLVYGATTSAVRHRVSCPVLTVRQTPRA